MGVELLFLLSRLCVQHIYCLKTFILRDSFLQNSNFIGPQNLKLTHEEKKRPKVRFSEHFWGLTMTIMTITMTTTISITMTTTKLMMMATSTIGPKDDKERGLRHIWRILSCRYVFIFFLFSFFIQYQLILLQMCTSTATTSIAPNNDVAHRQCTVYKGPNDSLYHRLALGMFFFSVSYFFIN